MKKNVYVLIGPSGSGKSTFAADMKRRLGNSLEVISSDKIREQILGDAADQSFQNLVWKEVYFQLRDSLHNPLIEEVVIDATNVKTKDRNTMLKYIIDNGGLPQAIIFTTSQKECVARDASRQRTVGETVIKKQFNSLSVEEVMKEKWKHIYEMGEEGWKIVL